jgi:hypothetical protein
VSRPVPATGEDLSRTPTRIFPRSLGDTNLPQISGPLSVSVLVVAVSVVVELGIVEQGADRTQLADVDVVAVARDP